MDWMWSALHLDDGTHLHGLDLHIPNVPPMGVGYIQDAAGKVTELESVNDRNVFGANGLPLRTSLVLDPGGISGDVEVRGHAPVRLTAPDGRVSEFARAWVNINTADGRSGVGWMEWNRNLPNRTE
jgi:hypothetical protein